MRVVGATISMVLLFACDGTVGGPPPGDDGPPPMGASGPYFETPMFFNRDVTGVAKATDSDAIIASLRAAGGWGNGDVMQIDFSIDVLAADATTPHLDFTPTSDWGAPDCDLGPVPVPPGGDVEGETGYACTGNGDCHLLVFDK